MLLQITDTHLFADKSRCFFGANPYLGLEAVISQALDEGKKIDGVLLTGDISQDHTDAAYQHAVTLFERFDAPIYYISGNHDTPENLEKVFANTYFKHDKIIQYKHWRLILLNTQLSRAVKGHLDERELALLKSQLEQAEAANIMLVMHHPPFNVDAQWLSPLGVDNAEDLFSLLENYPSVKAILCGHVHQAIDKTIQQIHCMTTPSTSIQFKPVTQEFALDNVNPGYRWIRLCDDGSIETEVKRTVDYSPQYDLSAKGY